MRLPIQVGVGIGALLLCIQADARACDVTRWLVSENEGPCLSPDNRRENTYEITNECDELVTLTRAECVENCSPVLELEPGETGTVVLPSPARQAQAAEFRYVVQGEASTIRFTYQLNECDDGGGCSVGRRRHMSYPGQELVVLLIGIPFWSRQVRGKAQKIPTAPRNTPAKSNGT